MHLSKLQRVQNSAARLITQTPRYCHITPVLFALHWLPMKFRICYKIAVISFKGIHNMGPAYLSNLINIKQCSRYNLRSIHSYTGLYTAIEGHTQLYRARPSYTWLYRAIQGYTELYSAIHSYKGQYRAIYSYTGLYTAIKGYTQLFRAIRNCTGQYTAIQGYTQLHRTIHSYTGLCTTIQGYTKLYRAI